MTLIRPPVMPMATNMRHEVQLILPLTLFVNLLPHNSLEKHERQPGEEAPIGLILFAESSSEPVEFLQIHKDGITVAAYWTELPPKAELEQKLHAALLEARERLARRGVLLGDLGDE